MKKIILITGVSSGFGKETARLLAQNGHTVYGTVRRNAPDEMPFHYLTMDLTDIKSIRTVVKNVIDKEGRIDVLINNAGMHTGGPAETIPSEYLRLQMDTNFTGMAEMTREVLPYMRKQGGGTIINFSSIGGLMGLPYQAYYSASKFAIEGFSEALRIEVNSFNIKIVVINPGDFHTSNSANRRNYLAPSGPGDPYAEQYDKTLRAIEKDEAKGWDPEIMAKRIAGIVECRNPKQRYIIGSFEQKLSVYLKNLLPGKLFRKILQDYYKIR